jgi:hypothetical protein
VSEPGTPVSLFVVVVSGMVAADTFTVLGNLLD